MKDNRQLKELLTDSELTKIRHELGRGYSKKLQEYILEKTNKQYALITIRSGLTKSKANNTIIKAAIEYLDIEKRKQSKLISSIR